MGVMTDLLDVEYWENLSNRNYSIYLIVSSLLVFLYTQKASGSLIFVDKEHRYARTKT